MRTPLSYYGGKQRLAAQLLEVIPHGPVFVEPFAGGLAVLFARPRAAREVVNDLDGRVAAFWRAVRDHPEELANLVAATPYSRAEWEFCRANPIGDNDIVETARRLIVTTGQSYGLSGGSWVSPARGGWRPGTWERLPPRILAAATRLQGVAVENTDAVDLIARCDQSDVVIYADPPYPRSTRSSGGAGYQCDDDGELWPRLVDTLLATRHAQVVLSSYPAAELEPLEQAGWRRVDLTATCAWAATGGRTGRPPEAVWLSPTIQTRQTTIYDFTTGSTA